MAIELVYDKEIETWIDINCLDIEKNMYMISSYGRIVNKYTNHILHQHIINSGYYTVYLKCDGSIRNGAHFLVHRLVLLCFSGMSQNSLTVNHKDCIKINNQYTNLEWMTQKENNEYKYQTNTDNSTGEDNKFARITNVQAELICQELEKGTRYKDILAKIGYIATDYNDTMYDLITNIKLGNSWKHISKNYDFSKITYNHSSYSNDQIQYICKCLEEGVNIECIYNSMHDDKYKGSRQNKSFYEMVRRIKNRQQFLNISKDYSF